MEGYRLEWKICKQEGTQRFPSDAEFAQYFRELLNPMDIEKDNCLETKMYCPVLDDPISEIEVHNEIRRLTAEKVPGPDGIPPGILKVLSDSWIWLPFY